MSVDDPMTVDERRGYLREDAEAVSGGQQGSAQRSAGRDAARDPIASQKPGRLIGGDLARRPRRRQRSPTYGLEVRRALGVIAESLDPVCAERLQPNLVWMAQHLARHGELEISPALLAKLEKISVSTVWRLLKDMARDLPRLLRKGPQQANRHARESPARRIPWDEQQPGHFEVDPVHHTGVSTSGQYVHSLQLVDAATGWSERAAILGRSYSVMQDAFQRIQARLPFPILELHPDNDGAFLNRYLMQFWGDQATGIRLFHDPGGLAGRSVAKEP